MHPDISKLPSRLFYQGHLQDGPGMESKTNTPWQGHKMFGTYQFFNVSRGQEEPGPRQSLKNPAECDVAVALYSRLRREFHAYNFGSKVGVVSMYSAQVQALRYSFEKAFGQTIITEVDFHTVDGFQGQEKEVIILSCVRAGTGLTSVGFLTGEALVLCSELQVSQCSRYPAHKCCPHPCQILIIYTRSHAHTGTQ